MAKYMIHAVPKRMWYVEQYLIKSIVKQGISCYDISVYCDDKKEGNLTAFRNSLKELTEDTWHLQDDVLISSKFAEVTKSVGSVVVCGFCSSYSKEAPAGEVIPGNMWYSFPCVKIPKRISDEFLEWLDGKAKNDSLYRTWIKANKYDDSLFMEFLMHEKPEERVLNIKPNIVDHVDYLIGGSIVNKSRDYKKSMSIYFDEPQLVEKLKEQLNGKCRSKES